MSAPIKILLYYKYTPLDQPEQIRLEQKALCQRLNLKGRILIADEGMNGTIAGAPADIDEYISETIKIPGLEDMEWKISWAEEQVFPKLRVVVRDEIVTLGFKKSGHDVSIKNKADYIQPEELLALYEAETDFLLLDARNSYEATIGKFHNALVPPIENFRDFPAFVENELAEYKDKLIVTYCTGGVRCEKASALLREKGFTNVRQLHGGIHNYGEKTGGKYFEGELFVFDKRLHVAVNTVDPSVLTRCIYCHTPLTRYVDCTAFGCDGLFICCESCQAEHHSACGPACEAKILAQSDLETNQISL